MSNPIKITATVPAWLTSSSSRLEQLIETAKDDPADALSRLGYSILEMDVGSYPWVRVGEAEITVTLMPLDTVVAGQVAVPKAELQQERAESMRKQNAILDRISKLSALTFDGAVTESLAEQIRRENRE
jgi:hypothetical protein